MLKELLKKTPENERSYYGKEALSDDVKINYVEIQKNNWFVYDNKDDVATLIQLDKPNVKGAYVLVIEGGGEFFKKHTVLSGTSVTQPLQQKAREGRVDLIGYESAKTILKVNK